MRGLGTLLEIVSYKPGPGFVSTLVTVKNKRHLIPVSGSVELLITDLFGRSMGKGKVDIKLKAGETLDVRVTCTSELPTLQWSLSTTITLKATFVGVTQATAEYDTYIATTGLKPNVPPIIYKQRTPSREADFSRDIQQELRNEVEDELDAMVDVERKIEAQQRGERGLFCNCQDIP